MLEAQQQYLSPFDLITLRVASIAFASIMLLVDTIYMSYSVINNKIGFNPALNQILITISDLVGIALSFSLVHFVKRKTSGIIVYLFCAGLSLITYFIKIPSNCENCGLIFLQMGLVMMTCIFLEFQMGILFVNQA